MKVQNCCMNHKVLTSCMDLLGIDVDFPGDCWVEAVVLVRGSVNIFMKKCKQ